MGYYWFASRLASLLILISRVGERPEMFEIALHAFQAMPDGVIFDLPSNEFVIYG